MTALLVSERSHTVGAGQVRLRRLRGVGPFSGVLEMRGIEEGGEVAARRARKHPNVTPVTIDRRPTLDVQIYGHQTTSKLKISPKLVFYNNASSIRLKDDQTVTLDPLGGHRSTKGAQFSAAGGVDREVSGDCSPADQLMSPGRRRRKTGHLLTIEVRDSRSACMIASRVFLR